MKRLAEESHKSENNKPADTRPIAEQIRSAVCPLADKTYEEQIKVKMDRVAGIMNRLRREVVHNLKFLKDKNLINYENVAVLSPFVKSPVLDGYRNKCEFSIGHHPETNEVTVGFRLSSYKKGSVSIGGLDGVPFVSERMRKVAKRFEEFLRQSDLAPFDFVEHKGHWKTLTVRTTRKGDLLVWAILESQDLDVVAKERVKDALKTFFAASEDEAVRPTSLHIQFLTRKEKGKDAKLTEIVENLS